MSPRDFAVAFAHTGGSSIIKADSRSGNPVTRIQRDKSQIRTNVPVRVTLQIRGTRGQTEVKITCVREKKETVELCEVLRYM